jgi:hypothetical protein
MAAVDGDSTTREDLLKKAWTCDPVLIEEAMYWSYPVSHPKTDVNQWIAEIPKSVLKFHKCPDQDDNVEMRKAFLMEYLDFGFSDRYISYQSYDQVVRALEESKVRPDYIRASGAYSGMKRSLKNKQEEQEKFAAKAAKDMAIKTREAMLRSGAVQIANFDDAVLLYDPKRLWEIMRSPLLRPDNALYTEIVTVDGDDGKLIRVKIGVAYAELRVTKKTINYSPRGMRIGGAIKVIGRYVQNMKYKTIAGEGKVMPVIEVTYIGDAESAEEAASRELIRMFSH